MFSHIIRKVSARAFHWCSSTYRRSKLKNHQNTYYPRFSFTPGIAIPQTGVLFLLWRFRSLTLNVKECWTQSGSYLAGKPTFKIASGPAARLKDKRYFTKIRDKSEVCHAQRVVPATTETSQRVGEQKVEPERYTYTQAASGLRELKS